MNVMIWQFSPYFIPFIACGIILAILGITGWRNRSYPCARSFSLLMFAASLWAFCTALELASADLPTQMLAIMIEYPAMVTIPVAWLLFAFEFTGREHWITGKNVALLFVIPAFTVVMVVTDTFHHLFYTSVLSIVYGGLSYHVVTYGPAFWVHSFYSYLLVVVAIILIVQRFVFMSVLYRGQVIAILIAVLTPLCVNIALVFRVGSLALVDPTPFALVISGFAILIGMMRYQLLDIMPIAQEQILGNISDGVVVVDMQGRIISLNSPAERFIGIPQKLAVGVSITTILPCSAPVFDPNAQSSPWTEQYHEMERETDGKLQYFELRCIPILSRDSGIKGRLIMIRDISDQKQAENALSLARKKLNLLSSITRHDILNQVTGLLLNIEVAKEMVKDPETREWLVNQDNAARNIQHQIEFARDYENLGVNAPQWMNINRIFQDLKSIMVTGGITFHSIGEEIELFADPLLERVFYNLIDNSIRHGKHVTVVSIRHEKTADGILFVYEDNGIGIPAEAKEHIFKRNVGKHTGLGLFLVKEILEITEITIRETGMPGAGARFEIRVPEGHYRMKV